MQSVSIDAGVLAAPTAASNRDAVYAYVDTLLDWRRLLVEPWISVYLSERASGLLVEEGLYPLREALKALFKSNGIVEFDVNTVAQVAERLLMQTPSFETYFRIRDVLADPLETDPELLSLTVGQHMATDLGRCVVLLAILRQHCRRAGQNHSLIVRNCPQSGRILVRAVIHEIEHEREDVEGVPSAPEVFNGEVLTCSNFRGLLLNIDEAAAWRSASDEIGKKVAVKLAVYKSRLARELDPEWDEVPCVRFGKNFVDIADRVCQASPDALVPKLLRSIVETAEKLNLPAVHALRENQSGGAPQRERRSDGAMACRRDIDKEYHLHYWHCPDGITELASMGPHNDFSIPE